jgi:hypothetical protein
MLTIIDILEISRERECIVRIPSWGLCYLFQNLHASFRVVSKILFFQIDNLLILGRTCAWMILMYLNGMFTFIISISAYHPKTLIYIVNLEDKRNCFFFIALYLTWLLLIQNMYIFFVMVVTYRILIQVRYSYSKNWILVPWRLEIILVISITFSLLICVWTFGRHSFSVGVGFLDNKFEVGVQTRHTSLLYGLGWILTHAQVFWWIPSKALDC